MASSPSTEFHLFKSFPADIHSLIMESCPPNDLICLRLTCKYLYNLSLTKEIIPLDNNDLGPLCCYDPNDTTWKDDMTNWSNRWPHRRNCHRLSYTYACQRNQELGLPWPQDKRCRTHSNEHCDCYLRSGRLHNRLRSWMPKGLRYCGECLMFTRRKKNHNGRCYHGRPKPRVYEGNYWTHRSRKGAFGYKLWKKWFNNAAMNKFENRLRSGKGSREQNKRYGLRKLDKMKVDTSKARDTSAITWDV